MITQQTLLEIQNIVQKECVYKRLNVWLREVFEYSLYIIEQIERCKGGVGVCTPFTEISEKLGFKKPTTLPQEKKCMRKCNLTTIVMLG